MADPGDPTSQARSQLLRLGPQASRIDRVAAELRRAVFDGELEARVALREVALTESLGVSRSTLREALTILVALTGSNRLVALADSLGGELKVALAQIDRLRRNAHDQAASHKVLVELLESGQVVAAAAELERHLAGAAVEVAEAIGLSGSGQAASAAAGA